MERFYYRGIYPCGNSLELIRGSRRGNCYSLDGWDPQVAAGVLNDITYFIPRVAKGEWAEVWRKWHLETEPPPAGSLPPALPA